VRGRGSGIRTRFSPSSTPSVELAALSRTLRLLKGRRAFVLVRTPGVSTLAVTGFAARKRVRFVDRWQTSDTRFSSGASGSWHPAVRLAAMVGARDAQRVEEPVLSRGLAAFLTPVRREGARVL